MNRHRRLHCRGTAVVPPQHGAVSPIPTVSSMSDVESEPAVLPSKVTLRDFEEFETAFRGRLKSYRLRREAPTNLTIPEFLNTIFDQCVELTHHSLEKVPAVKLNLWLECEFTNIHNETCRRAFKTKNIVVYRSTVSEQLFGNLFQKLVDEKEACAMKGSGWTFVRVLDMEIRVNVYRPLGGSSYIALPPSIVSKCAVINVFNGEDHKCFMYAILSKFVNNPHHHQLCAADFTPEVYARANLDFSGMEFPVRLDKIRQFEQNNGVSVNVYGLELNKSKKDGKFHYAVYPLRVADNYEYCQDHFDLLYLTNDTTSHYAYIKNFERLVRSQLTFHKERIYICKRCFAHFNEKPTAMGLTGAERLSEHLRYCNKHAPLRTDVPEDREIRFQHLERTQKVRFTIYADFECALVPHEEGQPLNPQPTIQPPAWDPATKRGELPNHHHRGDTLESDSVRIKRVHKPYAYAYYVKDSHRNPDEEENNSSNTFSTLRLYRGEDAARHFMESIKDDVRRIGDMLYSNRRDQPQLSAQDESDFQSALNCYICDQPFTEYDDKVRDHQHSPPYRFRGAAHRSCNLKHKEQDTINVYFHNLSNYDAHFIVRELAVDSGDVHVLANTEEKYISFSKRFSYPGAGRHGGIRVRFVDSYRFLSKGLATLSSILPVEKKKITAAYFTDPEEFDLVQRKGVFPYEYVTSLQVLDESVLPPVETFGSNLPAEDYAHAQRVWDKFECKTLGDYADMYLRTDVLLLADIFEEFRVMCLQHYGLDPAHYLTLPSYAWDVMLSKTGVVLDTLQDVDQYLFFEKGIRGGLAQCVTRHAVANNKYTRSDSGRDDRYVHTAGVSNVDDEYIMYYDANNLYGWAMSEPLPYGDFKWLSRPEIESLDIKNIAGDDQYGYVLEVDLEYPRDSNLHDRHRDLPFCPEVRRPPADQLPYSENILRNCNAGRSSKLMATLYDKDEYVIHYRLLQQAMENGMRVRHIHRVLRFKQSAWLKPYVLLNTRLRQQTNVKFEMELFKLMNNAVYGMSLQNVRKHINIKLATNADTYIKYVAKSNFGDRTWYNENLVLLHMAKVRVVLDKPVYVGMCILDYSKWWMYGFHYRMVERYGIERIRLIYMDTDSLIYKIRTTDIYEDMLLHREDFDTSNYPRTHICYDEQNARVLGKFKDEANGVAILEFIGLMAKLYCIVFCGSSSINDDNDGPPPTKRAKGVNRAVVESSLTVDDYRKCLQQQTVKYTNNDRFQSIRHIMCSVDVRKRSLAPYDDKRYVMPEDGVNTLPWGHYAIPPPPPPLPAPPSDLPPQTSH